MDQLLSLLEKLLYRNITVYVTSYQSIKFSGVLVFVNKSSIRIVLKKNNDQASPKRPMINFNKKLYHSEGALYLGAIVEIPIDKIDAVVHYSI
ncbi:MAG: hypothetical protein CVU84_00550 [Firmicutes bacterium HGW-Firmicutes-1]|jgi:hypothetical protein|nr:MAG: hypothetical protein CVU84_00550 [Firmicutes bacterium HGW-Firmicutes-1]